MNYIQNEIENTILHGWQTNKSPEEVSSEIVRFIQFVEEANKLYQQKRRNLKRKSRRKSK